MRRLPFLLLLKVLLLSASSNLLLASYIWVFSVTKQENRVKAQTLVQSNLQSSQSANRNQTNPPTQQTKQEEEKKSDEQKKQDLPLVVVAAIVAGTVLIYLGVLKLRPLWLLLLPAELKIPKLVPGIPEFKLPVPILLWLKYRPKILDAWVKKHMATFAKNFEKSETVAERKCYVSIPVQLDNREIDELTVETLRETFKQRRVRLLIWGEGGSGKTTLACQIAKWAMEEEKSQRLCEHLMLPILIEQELDLEIGEGKKPLMEALAGELQDAIDSEQQISDELVEQLLRQRRIIVIVDRLSEMSEETRKKIKPAVRDFPANALVITSRIEEDKQIKGIDNKIKTLRFDGEELVSFIKDYLKKRQKWQIFENEETPWEFLQECAKVERIVGERKTITVLLAKLYAERMINAKENVFVSVRSLDNIPALIVDHLEKLNNDVKRRTRKEYHTLKQDAQWIAWKCLEREYKPSYAKRVDIVAGLETEKAENSIEFFEKELHLIVSGNEGDTIRFVLESVAEYLAGLYLVENYKNDTTRWSDFLKKAESKRPEEIEKIKGFLLAIREGCLANGSENKVPGFVEKELGRLAGLDLEVIEEEQLKQRIHRLTEDLSSPFVEDRRHAAETINGIGLKAKSAASALLRAMKDEDFEVRFIATNALGKIGKDSEPVVKGLVTLLKNENSEVRSCAAEALGKIGKDSESVVQSLVALLTDEDSGVCRSAANALGNIGNDSKPVVEGLVTLLKEENSLLSSSATDALGKIGKNSELVVERLLTLLKHTDYWVRSGTAYALGNIGNNSESVVQGLLELLTDKDSGVRFHAANALGNIGNDSESVVQGLLALLEDADDWVRSGAAYALGNIGNGSESVVQSLVTLLTNKDSGVCSGAAYALGNIGNGSESVVQGLVTLLTDEASEVRSGAADALGKIGNDSELVMRGLMKLLKDKSERVRKSAIESLEKL
ncbi:hypothetical protein NUACC21_20900 [Scytonema sp. NUACC21]